MKDNIFIGWSGKNDTAVALQKELECKYDYKCFIGGNADNDSSFSSVGDTVLQQIKNCNQAIVIFQNRADGAVSNNLFFELGYVLSSYGQPKVHCVKRRSERIILPSDFDNSFVEPIDDSQGEEAFIHNIVSYFVSRQKLSIKTNKIYLIDNRYLIHDLLKSHYSKSGSKCSDYELAQYVLFYMQAAHMFGDRDKVLAELLEFMRAHKYEFSNELDLAVNIAITFLDFICNIKLGDGGETYVDVAAYRKISESYKDYLERLGKADDGLFYKWADIFMSQQFCYIYNLYAYNPTIDNARRDQAMQKVAEWSEIAIGKITEFQNDPDIVLNNDHVGLLAMFNSYVYMNRYYASCYLDTDDKLEWIKRTKNVRTQLMRYLENGMVDSHILNTFETEYYMCIIEYVKHAKELQLDEFEIDDYVEEIDSYIRKIKSRIENDKYICQLLGMYKNLKD